MKNLKLTDVAVLLLCMYALVKAQRPDEGIQQNENHAPDRKDDDPVRKTGSPVSSPAGLEMKGEGSRSSTSSSRKSNGKQPHIMMIVIDDLGWNDVDWRDSSLHTPVMTRLAKEGVVLNQSYVQPVCSPSRAAFLSGFYPYHLGLQHESLRATQKAYLPANITTLPQYLKKLGYMTHMAGKWHLGFCNWKYTPTYRGFDSFLGYYNAIEDYYTHIGHYNGYDFRHNEDVYFEGKGTYSAFIFTQYILQVIRDHNASQPLFVYLPYQSVHGPLQAPQVYIDKFCSHIQDNDRRSKCGMIAVLDEGVGNITAALQDRGLLNDTLLLITTDNGGPVTEGANNWPLRGSKTTLWEGGTRAMAFLHAPSWLGKGSLYDGVIHAVDWLPTLVEAAGGGPVTGIDGVSQWSSLLQGKVPSARTEFLYNMDELKNNSALRQGKFKLIQGHPGEPSKWYPPPAFSHPGAADAESLQRSVLSEDAFFQERAPQRVDVLLRGSSLPNGGDLKNNSSSSSSSSSLSFLNVNTFHGPRPEGEPVVSMTSEGVIMMSREEGEKGYKLYDLEVDPNEHNDVKDKYPDVFESMRARLDEYRKSLVPANFPPHDPDALPSNFKGVWSPGWC